MTEEVQVSEEQQKAIDNGWKPLEEWEGKPEDHVSYEEFNRRGEMIGNLIKEQKNNKQLNKEVKELKESIKILSDHNKKIHEQAKQDAIQELKELKKEALREGDVDSVVDIDDKIADIKSEEPETQPAQDQAPQETVDWLQDNSWYEENGVMRTAFDGIVMSLINENPELAKTPATALEEATKLLKSEFPEKFGTKPRKTTQTVTEPSTTKSKSSNSKATVSRMTDEQKKVAKRLINSGAKITMEEYAQQLDELGELA